ncbi:hypothetical protein APHAL10511_006027 [Amanita phalloides]|nr:hypothetical protein APHAL10511_006027 [Amanita phalloides]
MAFNYAFATLLTSDAYLPGALALAAALVDLHPHPRDIPFDTICLVTPETVDVSSLKLLRKTFSLVIGVELIHQTDTRGLQLLGRLDLHAVLTKLHVFRLTQFSKIIFLDADVLPIRPLSHLLTLPYDFSAVPDVGWPDIFNSGVFVFSPGEEKFTELMDLLKTKGSWDGGDQGILNEWRGNNWNRLSFIYNTTPSAAYTYAPAYERFGSQISAIHFIGPNKPWNSIPYRPPFTKSSTSGSTELAYDYNSLLDRWFSVYDQRYRAQPIMVDSSFELKKFTPVWEEQSRRSALTLEELKKVAIEGMHSITSPSRGHEGEGDYINLPLEGRVDLMRPKKLQPLVLVEDADTEVSGTVPVEIRMQDYAPSTPPRKPLDNGGPSFTWQPLPTPDPNDLPPSPRPKIISLPPTPSPYGWFAQPSLSPQPAQVSSSAWSVLETSASQHPSPIPSSQRPNQISLPLPHPVSVYSSLQHPEQMPLPSPHSEKLFSPLSQPVELSTSQIQPAQSPSPRAVQMFSQIFSPSSQVSLGHMSSKLLPQAEPPSPTRPAAQKQEHVQINSNIGHEGRRPPSPPLLLWNPAIEPPPTTVPSPSAFPVNTYFPNAWDRASTRHADGTYLAQDDTAYLFQPPPTPGIPKPLVQEGHYRQVTGEGTLGIAPSPDPSKVKHIFPWEDKPRAHPGRVFPSPESPSPRQKDYLTSLLTTSPAAPAPLSPLRGLPVNLVYPNTWDTVPGIQKYASRLRPPKASVSLAPAFDENVWKTSSEDKVEVSSRDGDDEDSSDGNAADDSDKDESFSKSSRRPSRRSSVVSASELITGKKKQYKTRGVQTIPKDVRNQSVQVNTFLINPLDVSKAKTHPSPPATGEISLQPDLPMSTALPSPVGEPERTLQSQPRSSGSQKPAMSAKVMSHTASQHTQPSIQVATRGSPSMVSRQVSNDSSLASPASSAPPLSPADGPVAHSPSRKGGRVWDPARGVELFKRGSEEVLARFLKMGSWENEASRPR